MELVMLLLLVLAVGRTALKLLVGITADDVVTVSVQVSSPSDSTYYAFVMKPYNSPSSTLTANFNGGVLAHEPPSVLLV